jgi:DNA-binding NarL/FixJ family response regulator
MIHVAIADDELLFRKGIKELLEVDSNIRFCLEAGNGIELLEKLQHATIVPDVLLLDISMPGMNGVQAFDAVRASFPNIKILILSIHYSDHYIVTLIEKGANGYLSKNTDPEEVKNAVITVARNDFYFNDATIKAMHQNLAGKHRASLPGEALTDREKEVLELICRELTAAEIADHLYISRRTAEGHRNSLLQKTGCKNTAGLVIYAIRHNVFTIDKLK